MFRMKENDTAFHLPFMRETSSPFLVHHKGLKKINNLANDYSKSKRDYSKEIRKKN